ncbi:MAG: inorganic phosphate transporter [Scytolyngbya sp. HA4215-MV1]|jgi:PiT family inorganic phosphate transporter|nr:inorganic phosphate transporter [Scytolyngbya sp. HA4215-MV1]
MVLILNSLLAFYLAWNLGANDVANSMGTSVGSKAISLRQALVIAGILEFTGAVLFGHQVSQTLANQIINPANFAQTPQVMLLGMMSVLLGCGVWMNVATAWGLPVSSSHAIVGALAGFGWVAVGITAVNWATIRLITLTWIATPIASGAIAALLYYPIQRWILQHPHPLAQLREWIPWLSTALMSVLGTIVFPGLVSPLQLFFQQQWKVTVPAHDLSLGLGAIGTAALTLVSWQRLERGSQESECRSLTPSPLHSSLPPPHPTSTPPHSFLEQQLARFQVISACFVAFAHGSNDVGNAVAPLAAIVHIEQTGKVALTSFPVPLWVLMLGGAGIVAGLAVWGKKVIVTVGEGIIPLQPSAGFCAELATATTVLLASRLGLPVSTSHALVGGVVGVGLMQGVSKVQFKTVGQIALAWIVTIPMATGLAAAIFAILRVSLSL